MWAWLWMKAWAGPLLATGEVSPHSALVWTAGGLGPLALEVEVEGRPLRRIEGIQGDPLHQGAATLRLEGLPAHREVRLRAISAEGVSAARFRTAPRPRQRAAVELAVMGDLGGHKACRPLQGGWPILESIARQSPDLLLANGDMIYADGTCPGQDEQGRPKLAADFRSVKDIDWTDREALRASFNAHWDYNRRDPAHQRLLSLAPLVVGWDDHEVINDFGAAWESWATLDPGRPGYRTLVEEGVAAFRAWNPVPERLWRSLRWGRHLELFVVDGRSHRSPNPQPDGPDKTMLGAEQLAWLIGALRSSTATWKVVSMNTPLSAPSGSKAWRAGRDSWSNGAGEAETPEGEADISASTGFERELAELLQATRSVENLVFVVTDAHYAQTIRYEHQGRVWHEMISGPLSARHYSPAPLDPSFGPTSLYSEGNLSNYGWMQISEEGNLRWTVRGEDGQERPGSALELHPAR